MPKLFFGIATRRLSNLRAFLGAVQAVPRRALYLGLGAMIVSSLLDGLGIGLMVPFLKILLGEQGTVKLPGAGGLNAWLAQQGKGELLAVFAGVLLGLLVFKGVAYYLSQVWTSEYKETALELLRKHLYRIYLNAPMTFYDQNQLGFASSTLQGDLVRLRNMFANIFTGLTAFITLLAYLGILLLVSWQMTLLIATIIAITAQSLSYILRYIKESGRVATDIARMMSFEILNTLEGIQVIKSYGTEEYELKRFDTLAQESFRANHDLAVRRALMEPLTETAIVTLALGVLVGAYALLISKGLLSTAGLLVFMLVLIKVVPIAKKINVTRSFIQESIPSLQKVVEALRLYERYPLPSGQQSFPGLKESLVFEEVFFSYPQKPGVLKGIDLIIARGSTVALVGASGAGKSTLAALIARFYEVTGGAIRVDGEDIRNFEVSSLRRAIGIVSQETYIFNTSVRNNIAYGLEGVPEEQIEAAARLANAHDFICELPKGYDTVVGDRGIQLSGGQRQRISIARAILRNPEVLILDEATSALDSESERLVQEALERLSCNRTVLIIAHRLATVRNADRIIVMEQGRILEDGEHNQLLARKGLYWSYHNLQTLPA
ncbi:ABC transporter ATP-binding protein [Anthocerotibacter panamensis]|uniref:ABC transporter ATP-binding protein n=1 Tax=Anthocerotibacter panamensis TaxID=2857077 RepID=UPI001C40501D|nr:ABC transporter ATP-binding protein [Anthocerotibacter panamensis]